MDDPYKFGQVAAANSLSDVYAMGGRPIFALNIVCFPTCLPAEVLGEILRGGADKVAEAGAIIAGGHSVDDKEPKYGLAVTGVVHPGRIMENSKARVGDTLILTKPLGIGIINTAVKGEIASGKNISDAYETMAYLNKYAMEVALKYDVHSCTDITGFGLMGHAFEMANGSNVTIDIEYNSIRKLDGAEDYSRMGIVPAGTYRNKKHIEGKYILSSSIKEYMEDILFDPQTSGGLLLSVNSDDANKLHEDLKSIKTPCSIIGKVKEKGDYYIYVR